MWPPITVFYRRYNLLFSNKKIYIGLDLMLSQWAPCGVLKMTKTSSIQPSEFSRNWPGSMEWDGRQQKHKGWFLNTKAAEIAPQRKLLFSNKKYKWVLNLSFTWLQNQWGPKFLILFVVLTPLIIIYYSITKILMPLFTSLCWTKIKCLWKLPYKL